MKLSAQVTSSYETSNPGDVASPTNSVTSPRKRSKKDKDPYLEHFYGNYWTQVILRGQLPQNRCNMGYAADNQYFYIMGGQDLNVGIHDSVWRISMPAVRDNIRNAQWEQVEVRGEPPMRISHFAMFVYQSKIFVFGGVKATVSKKRAKKSEADNQTHLLFNILSLQTFQWSQWRMDEYVPELDDFAHYFDKKRGLMWVFGGYYKGQKCNIFLKIDCAVKGIQILSKDFSSNDQREDRCPSPRAASRMIYYEKTNSVYLYGGLTPQNTTLNDMWRYDVAAGTWEQVKQHGFVPEPRCGHSFNLHVNKVFLFGGLLEITKESNETFIFNLETHTWERICGDLDTITVPGTPHNMGESKGVLPLSREGSNL